MHAVNRAILAARSTEQIVQAAMRHITAFAEKLQKLAGQF